MRISDIPDKQTREFSEACYDCCSTVELKDAGPADPTDMKVWGITAEQWREAVDTARREREADKED